MKLLTNFKQNTKGLECQNCGYPLRGDENFCPNCSQANDERRVNSGDYLSGFFANFFSFDSKLYKTLKPLIFKPGFVTQEYIEGKRKKYANPFRLYLHITIVFFLLTALISTINNLISSNAQNQEARLNYSGKFLSQKDSVQNNIVQKLDSVILTTDVIQSFKNDSLPLRYKDSLFKNLYDIGLSAGDSALTDYNNVVQLDILDAYSEQHIFTSKYISKLFKKNDVDYDIKDAYFEPIQNSIFGESNTDSTASQFSQFYNFAKDHKKISPRQAMDSLGREKNLSNIFWYQRTKDFQKLLNDKDYRKTYVNSIVSKISLALFFLLPLFALFVSLLYFKHPYNYTEHLVLIFNMQTVLFIFLIVGLLLDTLFKTDLFMSLLLLVYIFYIYKSLRNFYRQSRFITIVKFGIFQFVYFVLAVFGFICISFLAFVI